jgi:4-amino-4-deoxy-L-arabinose transferase-like glycosyltransferase
MRERLNTRTTVLIIALALILRCAFLLLVHPWTHPVVEQFAQGDSPRYHALACTLLDHHRFAISATDPPDPQRTPMYPLFVAGLYALCGKIPWAVYVAQILLDCASCLLILLASRRALSATIAYAAAVVYAVDPLAIRYASAFLTETLFFFVLALILYQFGRLREPERKTRVGLQYGLLGALCGLGALVRPIALYVPIVLAMVVLGSGRRRPSLALRNALLVIVGAALVVSPWFIRNQTTFGRATLTYVDAWDALTLSVGSVEAAKRHEDLDSAGVELAAEANAMMVADGAHPDRLNPFVKADYWRRLALQYIRRDPIAFLKAQARGIIFTLISPGTSEFSAAFGNAAHTVGRAPGILPRLREFFFEKSPVELAIGATIVSMLLLTYLALGLGLLVGWRRYDRTWLVFCVIMALYLVGLGGLAAMCRFRTPAMPFLAGPVGIGIVDVVERWRAGKARRGGARSA